MELIVVWSVGSTFLQQTLSTGYPRLLRLFHSFFAKIAVHTDTVYTQTQQRCLSPLCFLWTPSLRHRSPETILVLRALNIFQSLYLSRSTSRLNEAISSAFANGARGPPGQSEGTNIARTVANELDSAKFDPLLVQAVAKNIAASLENFVSRADALVCPTHLL